MRSVTPQVFLVGETRVDEDVLQQYLASVGAPEWQTDAPSESEELAEVMGRLCYRSFAPGLNPNVVKVREGSRAYLSNVIGVGHGSVLEHSVLNFIFADVSRVFTHELVRHRVGTDISQESLRFVRLTDLGQWLPTCIREDEHATAVFARTFEDLERLQLELASHFRLDDPGVPFERKKEVTSAMRRLAPIGLATAIGWSANLRTLRFVLEQRTDPAAEEEMRVVFGQVGLLVRERFPGAFADYEVVDVKGLPHFKPNHRKV